MVSIGYIPKGENGILGRRYFPKGEDKRTHHTHIFEIGNENMKTHLCFENYFYITLKRQKSMEN